MDTAAAALAAGQRDVEGLLREARFEAGAGKGVAPRGKRSLDPLLGAFTAPATRSTGEPPSAFSPR